MDACRIGFVMEQTLGHVTYHRNLERWAAADPSVRPTWIAVPCWADDRWSRMPLVRGNLSLTLSFRARDRIQGEVDVLGHDAFLFHTQATALCSLRLARRVPVIVSLDATPLNMDSVAAGYNHRADSSGAIDRLKFHWYRRLFKRSAALTTWSRWVRESLVRDYRADPAKIEVIPPGLDLEAWHPVPRHAETSGPVRLLFVGGDFARKGGLVLLKAFLAGLAGRCELDIVTGGEVPDVGGPIRVHRGLTHDGPELRRLFGRTDLFVLPTLADCSPLAILEAMACGLAVVATDVGAISEQVADGETGLLVPPGDPGALADALRSLTDDAGRRRALGEAGRRRAEALFDGRKNYGALVALVKRGVAEHAGRRTRRSGREIAAGIPGSSQR